MFEPSPLAASPPQALTFIPAKQHKPAHTAGGWRCMGGTLPAPLPGGYVVPQHLLPPTHTSGGRARAHFPLTAGKIKLSTRCSTATPLHLPPSPSDGLHRCRQGGSSRALPKTDSLAERAEAEHPLAGSFRHRVSW